MLSKQEVAELGLEPISSSSDDGGGTGVWGS